MSHGGLLFHIKFEAHVLVEQLVYKWKRQIAYSTQRNIANESFLSRVHGTLATVVVEAGSEGALGRLQSKLARSADRVIGEGWYRVVRCCDYPLPKADGAFFSWMRLALCLVHHGSAAVSDAQDLLLGPGIFVRGRGVFEISSHWRRRWNKSSTALNWGFGINSSFEGVSHLIHGRSDITLGLRVWDADLVFELLGFTCSDALPVARYLALLLLGNRERFYIVRAVSIGWILHMLANEFILERPIIGLCLLKFAYANMSFSSTSPSFFWVQSGFKSNRHHDWLSIAGVSFNDVLLSQVL